MPESNDQLTLVRIIGALLFSAKKPLKLEEIRKLLAETAETDEESACREFAKVKESEIAAALEQIKIGYIQTAHGVQVVEVAGGFRLQTDPACSPWLRRLLNTGRPSKLSKPTLETLAIIAYRQPIARSEIEAVRGVSVDSIVRNLMECGLIKITGRSTLPGHPLLYGTTQLFLEHFGLQSIDHLPGIEQLRRKEEERSRASAAKAKAQTEETHEGENAAEENDVTIDDKEDEYEDDDAEEDSDDEETEKEAEEAQNDAEQPSETNQEGEK